MGIKIKLMIVDLRIWVKIKLNWMYLYSKVDPIWSMIKKIIMKWAIREKEK
jgi:hypothetical protein